MFKFNYDNGLKANIWIDEEPKISSCDCSKLLTEESIFNEDVASTYGITNANPQFGKGGLPQYYVPDVQDLIDKGIFNSC